MRRTTRVLRLAAALGAAVPAVVWADGGYYGASAELDAGYAYAATSGDDPLHRITPGVRLTGDYFRMVREQPLWVDSDLRLTVEQYRGDDAEWLPILNVLTLRYGDAAGPFRLAAGRIIGSRIPRATYFDGAAATVLLLRPLLIDVYAGRDVWPGDHGFDWEQAGDRSRAGLMVGYAQDEWGEARVGVELHRLGGPVTPWAVASAVVDGPQDVAGPATWSVAANLQSSLLFPDLTNGDVALGYGNARWMSRLTYRVLAPDFAPDSIFWAFHPLALHTVEPAVTHTHGRVTYGILYRLGAPAWRPFTALGDVMELWSHYGELSAAAHWSRWSLRAALFGERAQAWRAIGLYLPAGYSAGLWDLLLSPFLEMRGSDYGNRDARPFGGGQAGLTLHVADHVSLSWQGGAVAGDWLSPQLRTRLAALWVY